MIRPVVMCKAPVAGRVKTRLQPHYSAAEAAALHAAMAGHVIRRLARLFPHTWIAADDPAHPFFRAFGLPVLPQGSGDLGARLRRMLQLATDYGAHGVLFTGTDSPHASDARLLAAMRALAHVDVVIGPVEDGGYDLIGMRGHHTGLFSYVPWGTHRVLGVTLRRLRQSGLSCRLLSKGFDVDTPEDVRRSRRLLAAAGVPFPPETHA